MVRNLGKTLVLGRYGDNDFGKNFYKELRKYRENVSYGEFFVRHFSSGETGKGENVPKPIDGITKVEGKKSVLQNPNKLKKEIQKADSVIVVYRGKAGAYWDSNKMFVNMLFLGGKLKLDREGMRAKRLYLFEPNEGFVKQDKSEYKDRETQKIHWGEPASIDIKRELLLNFYDRIATVCAHDSRGTKSDWIIKKFPKEKKWMTSGNWGKYIDEYGEDKVETFVNFDKKVFNIDVSEIFENYLLDLGHNRYPGTYVVYPDGTLFISRDVIDGKNLKDGGTIDKWRDYGSEGQGDIRHMKNLDIDLKKKSVVLIDDKMMTCNTMGMADDAVIAAGADHIRNLAVHPEYHFFPKKGYDGLHNIQEKRTKTGNKLRIHTANTVDSVTNDKRFDILGISVKECHDIFQ